MCAAKLEKDLSNCLINFDRRVLITELLDDYQLSYNEVNTIVNNFLADQEQRVKLKFEKRYLVHGVSSDDNQTEVYQIVEEVKLKEWLNKLQNSESSLYSVEIEGGAKSVAPVFKPLRVLECAQTKARQATKSSVPESSSAAAAKKIVKEEKPKDVIKQQPLKTTAKEATVEKISVKAEATTPEQRASDKKSALKKGITNFFAPTTPTTKKLDDTKTKPGVIKPTTPKKMMDFFKKQTEKPASSIEAAKKENMNTSVQLFDDNEEEPEASESSDEEDKLDALKRDIISSDVEMEDEENDNKQTTKRRRILDSDDEENDPPGKQEKLDIRAEPKEAEPVAETYLDEEGFVITKKPKQKATTSKSPATKKTPPVTIKVSPKEQTKKPSTSKEAKATVTKTKQAGIMNFFSKK